MTPVLLALLMCKRTRKMRYSTFLISCAYWLVLAVEAISLLENVLLEDTHEHTIYTTEAMISVVTIVSASYAIITLISYLSPVTPASAVDDLESEHEKFDFLYRAFVGTVCVLFCEIPLIVARFRMLAMDKQRLLPGTFYVWLIKDVFFVPIILVMIYGQKFGNRYLRLPCKTVDRDTALQFEPEKRDRYIHQYKKETVCAAEAQKDVRPKVPLKNPEPATLNVSKETKDMKDVKKEMFGLKLKQTDVKTKCVKKEGANGKRKEPNVDVIEKSKRADYSPKYKTKSHKVDIENINREGNQKDERSKHVDIPMQNLSPNKRQSPAQSPGKTPYSPGISPGKKQHSPGEISSSSNNNLPSKTPNSPHASAEKKTRSPNKKCAVDWSSDSSDSDEDYSVRRKGKRTGFSDDESPNASRERLSESGQGDGEESPKKDSRRVTFQFNIGEGKAIAMKSRSDSPGVVIDTQEKSPEEAPVSSG